MGATIPVIAMSRKDVDEKTTWHGNKETGACFYDGNYDSKLWDSSLRKAIKRGQQNCKDLREKDICGRYFKENDPYMKSCLNHKLRMPYTTDVLGDSIMKTMHTEFGLKKWKMVECGSKMAAACAPQGMGDQFPKQSSQSLCRIIRKGERYSCIFEAMPFHPPAICAEIPSGINKCRLWFNKIVKKA